MKTNDSGRLGFKDDGSDPSLFLIKETMAKAILPELEKLKSSVVRPMQITADLTSSNEEISTENVVAYIEGFGKTQ